MWRWRGVGRLAASRLGYVGDVEVYEPVSD